MPDIAISPLFAGRAFGARIAGLTIDATRDPAVRAQANDVFEAAGFIIFADVEQSAAMHVAISNMFGPLKDHPSKAVPRVDQDGMPGVIDMLAAPEENATIHVHGEDRSSWLPWHFDHAYNNELNRAGVLRALEIPSRGGLTGFVDGIELYQALSPDLRDAINGRDILYRMNVFMGNFRFGKPADYRVNGERAQMQAVMDEAASTPRALHPAVWTRDSGEKVLHVSPWMAEGIAGDENAAGDAVLEAVSREVFAQSEQLAYWHAWSLGDMLIWDNWRVLHAVSGHPVEERRRMQRTTIAGDYGLGRFEGGVECDAKVLQRAY